MAGRDLPDSAHLNVDEAGALLFLIAILASFVFFVDRRRAIRSARVRAGRAYVIAATRR